MKTLVRTNSNLFPAIPSLMDDFFAKDWLDSSLGTWKSWGATLPAVNIRETHDDYTIEVAAPGLSRKDFNVTLQNNLLTISSEWQNDQDEKEGTTFTRREFRYLAFQRSFSLPENAVDGDKIAAQYVDGILRITLPKSEKAKIKPPKQITVA